MIVAVDCWGIDTEVWNVLIGLGGALLVLSSLVFIARQVVLLKRQIRQSVKLHLSQSYQAIYDRMIEIDEFFVTQPEIKALVYGDMPWPSETDKQQSAMSACEMLADLFEELLLLHRLAKLDRQGWLSWNRYMRTICAESECFRRYMDRYGSWYTYDLACLLAGPVSQMREENAPDIVCTSPEDLEEDRVFWEIYESTFPRSQRQSRDSILRTISSGKGGVLRARYRTRHWGDEHTVGLAVVHHLENVDACFLVYLASARPTRNHGVGKALVNSVLSWDVVCPEGRPKPSCVVAEVEDPDLSDDEEESEIRERRLQFFRRCGFEIAHRKYFQPALHPDTEAVEMLLMVHGEARPSVREVVEAMYVEKYSGLDGLDSSRMEALLRTSFSSEWKGSPSPDTIS